ncbi:MAG: hypothetical protein KKA05_10550 [Alphaproteobacteria bacterium]|nr:hypothetical protein [Alphaproteobacteria bacterium]
MRNILKFVVVMATGVSCSFFGGFVMKFLWGWYVVPIGLNPISAVQGMGLLTLASIFFAGLSNYEAQDTGDISPFGLALISIARFMSVYIAAGLFGWLYHFFL